MSFHNWIDSPRLTYQWNSYVDAYSLNIYDIYEKSSWRIQGCFQAADNTTIGSPVFLLKKFCPVRIFSKFHQKRRLVAHSKVSMFPGLDYAVCVCVFFGWQWVGKPYKTLGCGMLRSEKAWFFGLNNILSQYVFKKSWECSTSFLFLVANKKSIYQNYWICLTRLETVSIRILTWVSDRPCRPGRGANVVGGPKEAYNGGSFNWKMIFNWKMGFLVLEFS